MGDYAAATLRLYGVTGKQDEILATLESGWGLEWGGVALRPEDLVEGVELTDTDCAVGWTFEGCGEVLRELGVSYFFAQEAKYEFDGTVEAFTPELGVFESPAGQEGGVQVPAEWIESAIERATDHGELCRELRRLTGHAWSQAFEHLAAATSRRAAAPSES